MWFLTRDSNKWSLYELRFFMSVRYFGPDWLRSNWPSLCGLHARLLYVPRDPCPRFVQDPFTLVQCVRTGNWTPGTFSQRWCFHRRPPVCEVACARRWPRRVKASLLARTVTVTVRRSGRIRIITICLLLSLSLRLWDFDRSQKQKREMRGRVRRHILGGIATSCQGTSLNWNTHTHTHILTF